MDTRRSKPTGRCDASSQDRLESTTLTRLNRSPERSLINPRRGLCTLLMLAISLLAPAPLTARPVSPEEAAQAVVGWLKVDSTPLNTVLGSEVGEVETFLNDRSDPVYHIVYLQPHGFVIVPAEDRVEPIVGFAPYGAYDPSTDNPLGALVTRDLNARLKQVQEDQVLTADTELPPSFRCQQKWSRLLDLAGESTTTPRSLPTIDDVRVDAMVETRWSQMTCCTTTPRACYNYYTPPNAPGTVTNYPCGCVATAMAQVMRYHEHPTAGVGVNGFQIRVDGIPQAAFTRGGNGTGGPYPWSQMVAEPDCTTTLAQRQAIGALCYDAGVAALMSYTPSRSSAFLIDAKSALVNTFDYSNAVYSTRGTGHVGSALVGMLNPNLDYGHPVIIAVGPEEDGHAVVVDGYGYYNGPGQPPPAPVLYHHLNMGWAGAADAWYELVQASDMPAGFSCVTDCVYNIFVADSGEIISGRATTQSGSPISGVTIMAVQSGSSTYWATTDDRGIYVLPGLPSSASFTISADKPGHLFTTRNTSTGTSTDYGLLAGNVWGVDFVSHWIYVDSNATGLNDGSSWTDAFTRLQDALAVAASGDQILVAQGTYYPDRGTTQTLGDRTATFQLISGVTVYGGFPLGGGDWTERDPVSLPCVLSGDIGTTGVQTDNSYHVVDGSGTDATAMIDGFTITAGYANGTNWQRNGAGMLNNAGSPKVVNCTFVDNRTTGQGGGMCNAYGNPAIVDCTFSGNVGDTYAGGMYNAFSSPLVTRCAFINNSTGGWGGAMYNRYNSSPIVTSCTFVDNEAGGDGGAIGTYGDYGSAESNPVLVNCMFTGNSSPYHGGAVSSRDCTGCTAVNCTFSNNTAGINGGGVYNDNSTTTLRNCILWGNSDIGGADESSQVFALSGTLILDFNCVQGWTGTLGGTGNTGADPLLQDSDGADDIPGTEDDNLRLTSGSSCIDAGDNDAVPADTADLDGDGNSTETTPLDLDGRTRFANDPAVEPDPGDSGTLGPPVVDLGAYEYQPDCNTNGVGDQEDIATGTSQDVNGNDLPDECEDCNATGLPDECDLDCAAAGGRCSVAGCGLSPDCNANGVPDECELAGADCNDNGVPDECDISAGTSDDLNANGLPDECEDCNDNDLPDQCDLNCAAAGGNCNVDGCGLAADCNGNGRLDECDLAIGSSQDVNGDGVPDECQDCNSNDLPDECDLDCAAAGGDCDLPGCGLSPDCNTNGQPDECDLADSTSEDCNDNDIPDECDISVGTSNDLNLNEIPDECEDCDTNGLPDECDLDCEAAGGNCDVAGCGLGADCNENLVLDACDLVDEYSQDVNSDGMPDECQDCNENDLPDECDLDCEAAGGNCTVPDCGLSPDCNTNGIPDECDIASGTSYDINEDGVPDECHSAIFVDAGATGADTGLTWADAYSDLQDALDAADDPTIIEIRVAAGTYLPDRDTGDRTATFQLRDGVTIYGGYAGGGQPDPDERDVVAYPTVLSGDLDDDDEPEFTNNDENSYHVVTGTGTNRTAVLDGFIITGGNANGVNPHNRGGGMYTQYNSGPKLLNCAFVGNRASRGGGMCNKDGAHPRLYNCVFQANAANNGAALFSSYGSDPLVVNCTIIDNLAATDGGGLYNLAGSHPTVTNSILWGNQDQTGTGESAQIFGASPVITYSCVQGLDTYAGDGNIGEDPLLVNADGPDDVPGTDDDNLRLALGSPGIDAGTNDVVATSLDRDGNSRFVDDPRVPDTGDGGPPTVDLGAHEFQPADGNCDGRVDLDDYTDFAACLSGPAEPALLECRWADLDDDTDVDLQDFAQFQPACPVP